MSRKIVKNEFMDRLETAIRQIVTYFLERYGMEEVTAICFRMHSETNADSAWRYLCEPILQTKMGYEAAVEEAKENDEEEFLLYYKYDPENFQYTADDKVDAMSGFLEVQSYLHDNGLDFEKYNATEAWGEREELYAQLMDEAFEIDRILAEVIAKLRNEKFLVNQDGKEFYVFPYVEEDESTERIISLAKIMNQGLDITEYIEFWDYE